MLHLKETSRVQVARQLGSTVLFEHILVTRKVCMMRIFVHKIIFLFSTSIQLMSGLHGFR